MFRFLNLILEKKINMIAFLHNFWVVQGIGAVALIFVVLGWNSKSRTKILKFQSINFVLFIIHYLLLSAYIGAVTCLITLARNMVFIKKGEREWASHPAWFWIFSALSVAALVIFWKGWITILPVAGIILGTYAVSRTKPKEIRFYMFIACLIWLPYTIVVHSYSGLISQIVGAVGMLMGMYRHDRKEDQSQSMLT